MGPGRDRTRGALDLQSDSHLLPDTLPIVLRGPEQENFVTVEVNFVYSRVKFCFTVEVNFIYSQG